MSVSNQAKRRGTILDEIMMYHRQQLPKTMREVPLADLRAVVGLATPPLDFLAAVKSPGVSLIAECKKASPSRGLIAPRYNAAEIAETYVRGGARAISVLTDGRHFQGSLADLSAVKEALRAPGRLIPDKKDPRRARGIPVLRKDFIFHPYQLYEARAAGADAVLLIAAVLEGGDLGSLTVERRLAQAAAAAEQVLVSRRRLARFQPVVFDPDMVAMVEETAGRMGLKVMRIASGAGHDAQMFAPNCPTAMIFVPSQGGISHNVAEYTAPQQVEAGANVLLQVVLRRAT